MPEIEGAAAAAGEAWDCGGNGPSFEAQARGIEQRFRQAVAGLRHRLRPWEIPSVLRSLQDEKSLSLRLLRERHAAELFADRRERKRLQPAPRPP